MTWRAETDQAQFDARTLLSIYWQPWGPGISPPSLSSGAPILVHLGGSAAPITITVIQVDIDEMLVQTSDQMKWKMVRATVHERSMAADTGGAPATYWIIQGRFTEHAQSA